MLYSGFVFPVHLPLSLKDQGLLKGWFWRMCPRSWFWFRGTCECTLIQLFVPGEHPNVPSFRFLECRKWGFKRWWFKQIGGYLRKKAFLLRFLNFSGALCTLRKRGEKGRKRAKKADFGRFPGRAARHPLSPHLLHPHLRQQGFRSGGTCSKTTLLENHPFWQPPKGFACHNPPPFLWHVLGACFLWEVGVFALIMLRFQISFEHGRNSHFKNPKNLFGLFLTFYLARQK